VAAALSIVVVVAAATLLVSGCVCAVVHGSHGDDLDGVVERSTAGRVRELLEKTPRDGVGWR
jgi:hypothetical protein